MTSPLPPKRRDSRGVPDLIRQDRTRLDQIDRGLVRGKFPPARLVKPIWSDGDEEDDPPEDEIFGEDGDRHTCFGPGIQRFVLSHIPLEETVHLFWHANADSAGVKWENEEHYTIDYERGAITINSFVRGGEVWPKAGHVFSAQYLWIETADDAEQSDGSSSLLGSFEILVYATDRTVNTGIILESGREYKIAVHGNFCIDGPIPHLDEFPPCGTWGGHPDFMNPQADSISVVFRATSEVATWTGPWGVDNPFHYRRSSAEAFQPWPPYSPDFWYSGGFIMGDPCGNNSDIVVGTGGELQFEFVDAFIGDNNGSLSIDVYAV